jgi:hypothetical protein
MSTLRTRFGIPGIIATAALVFAMTSGAFAAKYLITSPKQISPSVLKKLKGATGPAGAAGAAGAQGSQGPAGSAGANGEKGATGPTGPTGEKGEKGAKGAAGEPWTAGGTLPSEATETGEWAVSGTVDHENGIYTSISFPIPLPSPLGASEVHYFEDSDFATKCIGSTENPTAPPGHLCVYGFTSGLEPREFLSPLFNPAAFSLGAGVSGAVLSLEVEPEPLPEEKTTISGFGFGAWAVTAP